MHGCASKFGVRSILIHLLSHCLWPSCHVGMRHFANDITSDIYIYTYIYIYSNSDLCGLNPDFWFSTHNSSWLSPCFCCLNAKLLRFKTTFWCLSRSHHSYFSSFSPTILWTMSFPHQKVVGGKFLPYMVSENRLYHLAIFLLKMGF